MKTENPIQIISITALTDANKNLIANISGGLCNATDVPLGAINANTNASEQMPVMVIGIALVKSGGVVTAGDLVKSDANSKAVSTTTNDKLVLGKALDTSTTADELIRILL